MSKTEKTDDILISKKKMNTDRSSHGEWKKRLLNEFFAEEYMPVPEQGVCQTLQY